MAIVKPFYCIRPTAATASQVAALPYDVYSREEAEREVEHTPLSFLRIDRAETQFDHSVGTYDDCVYEKAHELLEAMIDEGTFMREKAPCYYLYELTMGNHTQTGIVCCSSVEDYISGIVKKHENTRESKEVDRIRHVEATNANTGPIFLTYRAEDTLKKLTGSVKKEAPLYDFTSSDEVRHRVFLISEKGQIDAITAAFKKISFTYIADGHHRAASAVAVAQNRRKQQPDYTGEEEFNYFLSVIFPDEELEILPYNRVVRDLNGLTTAGFLDVMGQQFDVRESKTAGAVAEKAVFGMYLDGSWYELRIKNRNQNAKMKVEEKSEIPALSDDNDPVEMLDVSLLQNYLLGPILGIHNPRMDERIEFIGGIRGLKELEKRVSEDMAVAFSMYPTSMKELLKVADAGLLMPPKSTWFEPKLRSGLFIHSLS